MAEKLNDVLRNLMANAFGGAFDSGVLVIYTGSQPASASSPPTGTILAQISLPADAFAAAAAGSCAKLGTWEDLLADNAGTAGWFRMTGTGGSPSVFDGACGLTGSGAELELDNVTISAGGIVRVTAFTFTQPAS